MTPTNCSLTASAAVEPSLLIVDTGPFVAVVGASLIAIAERHRVGCITTLEHRPFRVVHPVHVEALTLVPDPAPTMADHGRPGLRVLDPVSGWAVDHTPCRKSLDQRSASRRHSVSRTSSAHSGSCQARARLG